MSRKEMDNKQAPLLSPIQPAPALAPERESQEIPPSIFTLPTESQQQIRELAYQIYEQRGRADGHAEEDWIQAESLLLGRKDKLAA